MKNLFNNSYRRSELLLDAEESVLLLVDLQEKFRPVIAGMAEITANALRLVRGAVRLGVPVVASEQYPKGLGRLLPALAEAAGSDLERVEKLCFSAAEADPLYDKLRALGRRQIVLAGVETHICVLQTALDLVANFEGWVYVVRDAVGSRRREGKSAGLVRMRMGGVHLVTTEMALFEWLRRAGTAEFKDIQALVK